MIVDTHPSSNPKLVAAASQPPAKEVEKMFAFSNVTLFLVSEMNEAFNGTILTADGGLMQR